MNKAMALITILIITLLLFALVGAFLFLTTNARRINERYHENLIALGLAEAGADYAIWEINFDEGDFLAADGWSGANPKTIAINNFQDADGNVYGDINIWVYDPETAVVTIISESVLSSVTGPGVSRKIRVLLERHNLFEYAILTTQGIDVGGKKNKIDSYDSALGLYGGANVSQNGDIVTNGQGDPAIILRGGVTIEGDAITGPDGTVSIIGSASLTGTTDDNAEIFIPSVDVPDDLEGLESLGPLYIDKAGNPPLTDGNYKYDSLTLTGQGELILDGDVNLYFIQNPSITTDAQGQIIIEEDSKVNVYFDGNVDLAGQGALNEDGIPSDLTFYGTDTVSNINLAGIGEFYGTFYAPSADYFYISGNSEIYGAVVGKNVELTGSATIHYDEQLKGAESPSIGYDPYLWQEKE